MSAQAAGAADILTGPTLNLVMAEATTNREGLDRTGTNSSRATEALQDIKVRVRLDEI